MSVVLNLIILIVILFLIFSFLVRRGIDNSRDGTQMHDRCIHPNCPCHYLEYVPRCLGVARTVYMTIVYALSEAMANTAEAVTDVAKTLSASNCHATCTAEHRQQPTGNIFYNPGLVTQEYSDKDPQRLKSMDNRRSEIRNTMSTDGKKPEIRDAQSIDSRRLEIRDTESIDSRRPEIKDSLSIDTRKPETRSTHKSFKSDKISDYEKVFDRPPPPPFDKPPILRQSARYSDKSNEPLSQSQENPSTTRTSGNSAVPTQSQVSSGQDKLPFYPSYDKEKGLNAATSPVIAEAGSSKGKSTESQPSSEVEIQSCRKCLEKGRTCISDCPKAKDWEGSLSDMVPKVEKIEVTPPDTNISVLFETKRCLKCFEGKLCTSSNCPFRRRSSLGLRRNSSTSINLHDLADSEEIADKEKSFSRRLSEPPNIPFKKCLRCETGLQCTSCTQANTPRISFSDGSHNEMIHKEQTSADKTNRRKSSILRRLSRKSSIPLQIEMENLQNIDDKVTGQQSQSNLLDGIQIKSESEQDTEIYNDNESNTNPGLNTGVVASWSTIQEGEVSENSCPQCEELGEKCVIHLTSTAM
ncbi:uncharacterized protein LOC113237787 isoform X1 [Hyposmocoma kahamanoa]|uniref:uncharacterized protein LOC113237787 isoform X1 n=1 Tax=Hyposmocoma kahamanoa TaxID=1477025 RepID=UPI000E6D5D57|nr:uncharacterized protein LOC113237787 isoform X1 [Hyposmocoma kahamanoa]